MSLHQAFGPRWTCPRCLEVNESESAGLRDALRDAIPYLDAATARSAALSDEALSPRQIADIFRAALAGPDRASELETALRSLLAGAEHSHRMNQITAALDVGIEDARNALNPAQRPPNGS